MRGSGPGRIDPGLTVLVVDERPILPGGEVGFFMGRLLSGPQGSVLREKKLLYVATKRSYYWAQFRSNGILQKPRAT